MAGLLAPTLANTLHIRPECVAIDMVSQQVNGPPPASVATKAYGERRHATLLFMDLCASSHLAEILESEQLAEVVTRLRDIARHAITAHGGRIIRIQGDGLLALFGDPAPTEDDPRRAAYAALETHEQFEQVEFPFLPHDAHPLRLHSGLHAGLVLVAEGDIERGRLDLSGDAANTAARLASVAPPGVLLADLETLGPFANLFALDQQQDIKLPGRSKILTAVHVLRRSALERRFDATSQRGLAPFVGRQEVLDAASAYLRKTFAGGLTHCMVVSGEAGIGKTRLLEQVAQLPSANGFLVLRGHCEQYLQAQVLQPFVQMATALAPQRTQDAAQNAATLSAELLATLAQALTARPGVMLVDDWQWADDASRQLLDALLRLNAPLVVVIATRTSTPSMPLPVHKDEFALAPFSEAETRRTVRQWLRGADPFTELEIHRQAGGVPLFVEELCHSAALRQPLDHEGEKIGTSAWLRTLAASRLARMTPQQQKIIRTAAVLGVAMPLELLCEVTELKSSELDLEALAAADFLYVVPQGDALRFKHGLTCGAVYESIGLAERTHLHQRALSVLCDEHWRESSLEAQAHHARAAGYWREAADYSEKAGDRASTAFAYDVARAHYLAAMDALEHDGGLHRTTYPRWCQLSHKLGLTCIFDTLALPHALAIFERSVRMARQTGNAELVARSLYWLGYISFGHGQPRRAVGYCEEALSIASGVSNPRLAAQVEATLGQALAATCDYENALPLLQRALTVKRESARPGSGVAVGSAFTLATMAAIRADQGNFEAAHSGIDEAMRLLGTSNHPVGNSVRNWNVMILLWQGRWSEAGDVGQESVQLAEVSRALLPLAIGSAANGYARWMGQGSEAGFRQIAEAVEWMEQRGGQFFTALYYGWLVEGHVARGEFEQARHYAARLFRRSRFGEVIGDACGLRALALAASAQGDAPRALRYLDKAERSATARNSRRERALNLSCRAEVTASRDSASAAIAAFEDMRMHWYADRARRHLGAPNLH